MAILENNEADPTTQLWTLITQLGEQLSQNQSMSVSLYTMAGKVKHQASNLQTGFVLRRFNLDKTQEQYDAALEHHNGEIAVENQSLSHDNKQLSSLIREYEQTLESLMTTFRTRAQDVQERELSLIREFEEKLLAREEENTSSELQANSAISTAAARLAYILRQLLRAQNGEDVDPPPSPANEAEEREPWTAAQAADHALGREIELARLEKENEELRRMLGLLPPLARHHENSDLQPPFDGRRSETPGHMHSASGVHRPSGVINSGVADMYQRLG
ncbi:hypothetical protein FA15DRAFT_665752 [Coprinopsis marcescibilis]|uniref:Uncharacterized protein n=1 Tax=Coprinopsis marcescibilis TaxID=230819 RepID=A0A5C3L7D2_COPMA|nr:hypothetical protein FA15DRAFT_665752 [Coprinopsis marcescibilis]